MIPQRILSEPELNIDSLLSAPFDVVLVLDPDGYILNSGEINTSRFQLRRDEILGKCVWDLLPPEVVPRRKSMLAKVLKSGRAVRFQDERHGFWNDNMLIPVVNRQGNPVQVILLVYDITSSRKAEENIKLLARFPDENPSPVIRVRGDGSILYANAASGPLLAAWNADAGPDRLLPERICLLIAETISTGKITEFEEKCGRQTLSLFLTPITGSDFINIYGHDITDRKRAAEALQESEERFRNLVETSHDLIWRCDLNGRFIYLNPAWEEILGYTPAEMLGRHFGKFKPGGITENDKNIFIRILAGEEVFGAETTYISKDGRQINIIFNVRSLLDGEGNTIGTQGSAHNITERKQAEEKLLQSEAHYRNLFINNPAAILETDLACLDSWLQNLQADGVIDLIQYLQENPAALQRAASFIRILDINHSARKMLELQENENFSDIIPNIFHKNSYAMLRGLLNAIWKGQSQYETEGSGLSCRGNPLDFILQWSAPGKGQGVELSRGIFALTDVTPTKILKNRLIQSDKMATLGLLVSGISHEINNPNNFIMFNLPILRDYLEALLPIIDDYSARKSSFSLFGMPYDEFRKDIIALLDNMEHGTNRINNTVSRLREFFSPREPEQLSWTDIGSVVEKSVSLCLSQLRKMVKKTELLVPENLPRFYTDPYALEHIIINLLLNAANAADKESSWIRLKVLQGKNWQEGLIIEVKDNGSGIDKQNVDKIFDPFFTTGSPDSNSGLGMFICHNLIEGLGGRIDVKSKQGTGTTFRIILPEITP